jgi:hypothetical protein
MTFRNRVLAAVLTCALLAGVPLVAAQFSPRVYLPLVAAPPPTPTATTAPTATATTGPDVPLPTATPQLPPPDFVSCGIVGDPARAPNYPIRIVAIDKAAETVTLRNVSAQAVDLTGWRMCSVTGGQQHPVSGQIAAGESRTFSGPAASIWNNSSPDPGALWNPAGSLVSYWPD